MKGFGELQTLLRAPGSSVLHLKNRDLREMSIHGRLTAIVSWTERRDGIPKGQNNTIKIAGRDPSWCRLNSEYHKALAPFFIPS